MPAYKYKARDKFGRAINGVMEASGDETVASRLDGLGYIPVSIQEKKKDIISLDLLKGKINFCAEGSKKMIHIQFLIQGQDNRSTQILFVQHKSYVFNT